MKKPCAEEEKMHGEIAFPAGEVGTRKPKEGEWRTVETT